MSDELIETGSFARADTAILNGGRIRVVSWNINRGTELDQITEALRRLGPDLLFLQEVDHSAKRARCGNIAAQIAAELQMNYVFGSEFQELSEGCGDRPAFHGQATLCRCGMPEYKVLRFELQSSFWKPRWCIPNTRVFQRRAGGRMALMVAIEIAGIRLMTYNLHLESRGGTHLRLRQLEEVIREASSHGSSVPVLVAGDFNCDLHAAPFPVALRRFKVTPEWTEPHQATTNTKWRTRRPIDWILVGGPIAVLAAEVHTEFTASDHFPVSLTFQIPEPAR